MKGFRNAALVATAAYAITYGVLVFIEYRWIEAYQLAGNHAKFPPQAAWVFAALHATMIFGAIAIIGFSSRSPVVHLRMFSFSTTESSIAAS